LRATRLLEAPKPVYPEEARAAGREGTVVLRAVISTGGNLLSLSALPGSDPVLAAAAEAAGKWKYQPTLLNGSPVEIVTTVEVRFVLE
jgi:TonB family protein